MTAQNDTHAQLPVPVAGANARSRPDRAPPRSEAAFVAQLAGSGGERRGLKGGETVLRAARSAYLGAQWSGRADRRAPSGVVTKTKV